MPQHAMSQRQGPDNSLPQLPQAERTGIFKPTDDEVIRCFELEKSFNPSIPDAENNGFFLEGITLAEYQGFSEEAYFRVRRNDGDLAGFVIALPPDHPRMAGLRTNPNYLLDSPEVLQLEKLVWVAKVATPYTWRRQGIASELYANLVKDFPGCALITTTAVEPIINHPSESFHQRQGFKLIGTLPIGRRGDLENCLCNVYLRLGC